MARVKVLPASESEYQQAQEALLIAPDPGDEIADEIALERILTELGDDDTVSKCSIWRVNDEITGRGAGKDMYLSAMTATDFRDYWLEGIQNDYGEGKYRIKIFDGGTGRLRHNRVYIIGPVPKSRVPPPALPAPPASDAQGLAALAQAMQNGFSSLAQIMMRQGETAAGNRKAMLEELMLYKSLFAPAHPPQISSDPVAAITSAMSLLKEFGVGGGSGKETTATDVFLELAKEFGPAIATIAQNQVVTARQPRVAAPPVPAPQLQQAAPPIHPGPEPEGQNMPIIDTLEIGLRAYLPMFIAQAQAGNDSEKYADMILDNVTLDQAEAFANRPDWFEYLSALNPGVAANGAWFRQLRQHLLEIIASERAQDSGALTANESASFNTLGNPDVE